jgi:hypothetical protein
MNFGKISFRLLLGTALGGSMLFVSSAVWAQGTTGEPGRDSTEPNPLNNVYFGEQHLHTSASPDAFSFGTRNDANDAYQYAKGEPIRNAQTGEMIPNECGRTSLPNR